jgi:(1->4)-alpha-D-glucan 1-alpha-D-glucosylmutase
VDGALVGMIPRATYRLQFRRGFGFDEAAALAPYLAKLGISHIYASPWLKARTGSTHGYDIVDHDALNPELGDDAAFQRMLAALEKHGLRQILDFVPNHMGVGGADNPLWLDVLEWGPDSPYAGWFDIDWDPERAYLQNKLLVPFLAGQYGMELHSGKLVLKFEEQSGSFAVWVYDWHKLPICPLHYARILGDAHPELERIGDLFSHLPLWRPQVARRASDLKADLARVAAERVDVRYAIDAAVRRLNGTPGDPESWRGLHALIQDQSWRAAHFRVAGDDINYRRFFNINDLAGLRMELPDVFEHTHRLVIGLLESGVLDGLRIDHIDGLLDPRGYLRQLRTKVSRPFYLVVEKILAPHESLRDDWPVQGTTGYTFVNSVLGILIDSAGEEGFTRTYAEFSGETRSFAEIVRESKIRIMVNEMVSELNVLARDAARVARQNPCTADFTHNILRRAIREIVACFPVYRTYVDFEGSPGEADRRDLDWALKQARVNEPTIDKSVYDFLQDMLSGDLAAHPRSGFSRMSVLRCAMKVQQYSGPVMAKGLEDTAFYRYHRFVALNEVGGNPDKFGITLAAFHKANAQRAKHTPHTMVTTATHDTKRGEDTRARLAVLSEMPAEWAQQVQAWSRILRARRGDVEGIAPPDRNDEYLYYQLLVGTWPAEPDENYTERMKTAMIKSVREAKLHSTWDSPNAAYEAALVEFIEQSLDPERSRAFLSAFVPFQERIARLGEHNSLVQTVLKLTVPGVPDIYQGTELWDLSMADPDNRRPVDFALRSGLLESEDHIKLKTMARILAFRRDNPDLFTVGEYEPVTAEGPRADHICAFTRRRGEQSILVAVARFPVALAANPDWSRTALPGTAGDGPWRELLTGGQVESLAADDLFGSLPAVVLVPESVSRAG